MKINEVYSVVGQYAPAKVRRAQTEQPQSTGSADKLELSSFAKVYSDAMAAARKDAQTSDAEYQAHLQDVTARFQSGSYHVSAEDVSAKMLQMI